MNKTQILASTAALMLSSMSANAIVIDNFDSGLNISAIGLAGPASGSVADATVIGGERDVQVNNVPPTPANNGTTNVQTGFINPFTGAAILRHDQDASSVALTQVVWDGNGADGPTTTNYTGLGGIDLTEGGTQNAFTFDLVVSQFSGLLDPVRPGPGVIFVVYTSATQFSSFRYTAGIQSPFAPATTISPLFSEFVPTTPTLGNAAQTLIPQLPIGLPVDGGADFTNVGAISMIIDGSNSLNFDFAIDLLETTFVDVPAPASLALMGLVIGGMTLRKRKAA